MTMSQESLSRDLSHHADVEVSAAEGDVDQANAQPTHHGGVERALAAAPVGSRRCTATTQAGRPCQIAAGPGGYCIAHTTDPQAKATLAAARSAGGKAPRVNVQVGLAPAVAEAIDLSSSAGQLAILSATARALAIGRVSANTATALAGVVRTAASIVQADQQAELETLTQRVDQLLGQRVI
jgi:hypothetical protein